MSEPKLTQAERKILRDEIAMYIHSRGTFTPRELSNHVAVHAVPQILRGRLAPVEAERESWIAERDEWRDTAEAARREVAALQQQVADLAAEGDEVARLRRWKAEASSLFDGMQDLGRALGLPLGVLITGPAAIEAAAALTARALAAEAAVDRVRRRHPRGDEEGGVLAPGLWCPTCGRERSENGFGACSDRAALAVPAPQLDEEVPPYPAGHGWTPSTSPFDNGEACRVMLARYPCNWSKDEHDPELPPVDVDVFGYRRPTPPTTDAAEANDHG